MVLLELHLTLHRNQPKSAVSAPLFLGGILHGTFERLVQMHAPIICHDLGITPGSQLKHYATIPPPHGWQASNIESSITMKCGFILYEQAKQYTQIITALLKKWHEIHFKGRTDTIQINQILYHMPGLQNTPQGGFTKPFPDKQPNFRNMHSSSDGITLTFCTPLKLGKMHPPKLLDFVRSITRRIQMLEPVLANTLGLGSLAWTEAEEQIRYLSSTRYPSKPASWQYRYHCTGLQGQIHFAGYIPATITTLLHWGLWFGIGQSTALGQGMYYIDEPLINFESNN